MQIGRIFEKNETEQKLYNIIQECDPEKKITERILSLQEKNDPK